MINAEAATNYGRRLKTEELIKTAFEKAGIENFVVKGSLVASLYPILAYRTMALLIYQFSMFLWNTPKGDLGRQRVILSPIKNTPKEKNG